MGKNDHYLEAEIIQLKREKSDLERELKNLKTLKVNEISECGVHINFNGLRAISIERTIDDDGFEITEIGYLSSTDEIEEWQLYCSRETHERLCQQFVDATKST